MVLVLDTNVIAESMRDAPDPAVLAWAASVADAVIRTTAISLGELRYGVARLPAGQRRDHLARDVQAAVGALGPDAVLPYDAAAADVVGDILVERERAGRPIQRADAQIAAICRSVGAVLATRNVRDFEGLGLEVVDPWSWPVA